VKLIRISLVLGVLVGAGAVATVAAAATTTMMSPSSAAATHQYQTPSGGKAHIDCSWAAALCTEIQSQLSDQIFGHYVGHDEPSVLFDSNTPGSGNHMSYDIVLPKDPPSTDPTEPGKSYQFELSAAPWLGMAMCDTQSYPEQVSTCPADSDSNILDPSVSDKHVGQAYMEMQFYPPGWVPWPAWQVAVGASGCSATQWCAALNIDSLALNPVTNQTLNTTCLNKVGEEYVNFAFITKNGVATGPANPLDATTSGTFSPSPSKDLFMNSGDHLQVKFTDTVNGLKVTILDLTTGASGYMTASKANGFGQIQFQPNGTSCTEIPYDFHPMYSTSSPATRVTWAAGAYNIAFDTEIGHFQFCTGPTAVPATQFGLLPNGNPTSCPSTDKEGDPGSEQPVDGDDLFCFPASEALLDKVQGCSYTNDPGFDGASYQNLWPNGNTAMRPTPFQFTSPLTGPKYDQQYPQALLETDLPAVEIGPQPCNTSTGADCRRIPLTDDGTPATVYPYYSITNSSLGCVWQFGTAMPGEITDFDQNAQYGDLYGQNYTTNRGRWNRQYNVFERRLNGNPCE
jgi:hypothetical protein